MAAPKVRMQISAGVGSGENKKLKIKSIFMNSSRKFRPVKKKKRKEKEEIAVLFLLNQLSMLTEVTHTHTASNPPNSHC